MAIAFQGAYFQNFDSLANNGTNHAWTNDFTLPGWYLFRQPEPGSEVFTYDANNGISNKGSFYSYGVTDDSDRALGGLGSGGVYFGSPNTGDIAGWMAFAATNTTGLPLNSITLEFDGEQWRSGANTTPQTMVLEYGLGATFDAVTTWINPGENFDFTSPVTEATGGAVNGNMEGLLDNLGGTIHNLNWKNNQTLWIRWVTLNDEGHDHGLAIDNFSLAWYSAIITESDGITTVTEGETTDSYTVVLTNPPIAEVTITINPDHQTTTGVNSVIFTPENWNQPQTVEIMAVDDNLVEGNHISTITHTATSPDPNYNGISIDPITANIRDNDSANNPPVVVNAIADLTATESTLFNFTIPADTFNDPDGNPLSYSATLEDGSDLPSWLIFDATTRTFSGTPLDNHIGNINLKVTASDGTLSVSDIVTLSVSAVTPNPEVEGENPPELSETPVESEMNPPELSETPPESETNPPELSETPVELETNPPESKTNPPELSETPVESETNPPELSETPLELETNPPESKTNPPELSETPVELETNPPELSETPVESETNPPELSETPVESETNPPEWGENSLEMSEISFIQFQGFGPIGPSYFKAFLTNEEISDSLFSSSHLSQLESHEAEKSLNNSLTETFDSDLTQAIHGDDFIQKLWGDDSLFEGEGNDITQSNLGNAFIKAGNGTNWIYGGEGEDTLMGGTGVDVFYGNGGNDLIHSGFGHDFLYGNQGNDTLIGGEEDDVLYGGKGDDLLIGGDGEDWLFGDLGNDILIGGEGPDHFIIRKGAGVDLMVDFTEGEDLIRLSQGLTFNDLTFTQGNNGIFIYAGNELLAIFNELDISVVNSDNFLEVR